MLTSNPVMMVAVLALAVGAAAFTVTKTKVTAPFRTWIGRPHARWAMVREKNEILRTRGFNLANVAELRETRRSRVSGWFSNLVGCPYCLSHWLSWGATIIYRPRLIHEWLPLDLFVTSWVMIALAAVVIGWTARTMNVLKGP